MKRNILYIIIGFIVAFAVLKQCEGKPRTITKTVTKIETIYDTINTVSIKEIPKKVYIEKIKTVKGKDSIIIQNVPSENTTTANQYETKIQSNEASADLQITTTGELLNVSGIITFPKVEKTTTITKIKDKSGLYIYGQLPINNIASPEVGVLIQVRNKMFISTGVQYNNLSRQLDYKVGVGVKIW